MIRPSGTFPEAMGRVQMMILMTGNPKTCIIMLRRSLESPFHSPGVRV
jgi:hypothetical protein